MKTTSDISGQPALTIKQTALTLGLHEFSVFSRLQSGEINCARFPSGIVAVPVNELERLSKLSVHSLSIPSDEPAPISSDKTLGITNSYCGLKREGEHVNYTVPDHFRRFTETEIKGYRAAFSAIWEEYFDLNRIRKQLEKPAPISSEKEICTSKLGIWQVHSTLLNFVQSDILLCRKQEKFAVVERFRVDAPYAKVNGQAEILLEGNDACELAVAFNANARHTLEFMASDQVARAQKVIWEQFPDHRPGQIVEAISERCRLAVAPEERLVEQHQQGHCHSRGVRM